MTPPRHHNPPSIPLDPGTDPETREARVVYGPCGICSGQRPFLLKPEDPFRDDEEFVDIIVVLDEVLFHCHFPTVQ